MSHTTRSASPADRDAQAPAEERSQRDSSNRAESLLPDRDPSTPRAAPRLAARARAALVPGSWPPVPDITGIQYGHCEEYTTTSERSSPLGPATRVRGRRPEWGATHPTSPPRSASRVRSGTPAASIFRRRDNAAAHPTTRSRGSAAANPITEPRGNAAATPTTRSHGSAAAGTTRRPGSIAALPSARSPRNATGPETTNLTQDTAPQPGRYHRFVGQRLELREQNSNGPWTAEDNATLVRLRADNVPHEQVAYVLGRSSLACRLHHHHIKKKQEDAAAVATTTQGNARQNGTTPDNPRTKRPSKKRKKSGSKSSDSPSEGRPKKAARGKKQKVVQQEEPAVAGPSALTCQQRQADYDALNARHRPAPEVEQETTADESTIVHTSSTTLDEPQPRSANQQWQMCELAARPEQPQPTRLHREESEPPSDNSMHSLAEACEYVRRRDGEMVSPREAPLPPPARLRSPSPLRLRSPPLPRIRSPPLVFGPVLYSPRRITGPNPTFSEREVRLSRRSLADDVGVTGPVTGGPLPDQLSPLDRERVPSIAELQDGERAREMLPHWLALFARNERERAARRGTEAVVQRREQQHREEKKEEDEREQWERHRRQTHH
ncbi:hypothetical protein C1H76_4251 [Elsinoe australis]|uniref:Myb-like domain-containing protein n=1 Tax=Elsinoe australis TaxID=40998 RepID=A0A4U7B351_9PEZI|nr:hypothetical protein C1H76_4251 [Elsinoe australis]